MVCRLGTLLWAALARCARSRWRPRSIAELRTQWMVLAAASLLIAVAVDAWSALRLPAPAVARSAAQPPSPLGVPVEVDAAHRQPRAPALLRCEVHDHHPASSRADGLPRAVALAPGGWAEVALPGAAGRARRDALRRAPSCASSRRFGLWQVTRYAGDETPVRVYPNFRALARYTLLATDNRLSQIGVLQVRRRGEGTEFHQLREYRAGRPAARHRLEGDRAHRAAHRARIRGREGPARAAADRLRPAHGVARTTTLSHFDHALNAALLLAHVALRQGDAVGMLTMGGVSRYCEPRKSVGGGARDPQPRLRPRADARGARLRPGRARAHAARAPRARS